VVRRVALLVAAMSAVGGLAYLVYGVWMRPYGIVEAELVFQASRLQHGFPLYVDPATGAWELGAPPSRYYVLYTPTWPWVLAHLAPATHLGVRTVGRAVNAALYLATLAVVFRAARPERRVVVGTGALLTLGFAMLVREAGLATADMPAVALATVGLTRMIHKGGLDPISAALLAAAPLVKPSVLGVPVGAVLAHLLVHRRAGLRPMLTPLVAGGAVAAALVGTFHAASGGVWLTHIVRATGQTLSLERWAQEFGGRAVFLGAPHALVLVLAGRRRSTALATLPLATSLAWSTFSMAKHGSGTHYWLEPTMAALLALGAAGSVEAPPIALRSRALAWLGLAFTIAAGGVGVRELARAPASDRARDGLVGDLRDHCALRPGEVVVATDVSLELELDGRILVPSWQSSYLVRRGTFPLDAWRRDLARPEVRWFVDGPEFLEPPPERVEGITEANALRRELRDVIADEFAYDGRVGSAEQGGELLVYRRR